jgi:tetratricopeptide (TPR) repeat protein
MKKKRNDSAGVNYFVCALLIALFICIYSPIALAEKNTLAAGIVFYNQGKYEQALSYLSQAVKDDPNDAQAMYYFANVLVKTYNLGYAEKYYQRVIKLQPYSEIANLSRQALSDISDYKANIKPPKESLLVKNKQLYSSVNSYIQQITDGGVIIHWQKTKMPLYVYISPSKFKEYDSFAWKAFKDWESSSDGLISFEKVEKEEDANLVLNWQKKFSDTIEYDLNGYTLPKIDGNELSKYYIYIVEEDYEGQYLLPKAIYTYVLHQIGHALGISAHSENDKDVMFINGNNGKLTRRDISTLHVLYEMRPDISNFTEVRPEIVTPEQMEEPGSSSEEGMEEGSEATQK